MGKTAPISSVFSMHFATSYIWQTWTTTALRYNFTIPRTFEDNIDNDQLLFGRLVNITMLNYLLEMLPSLFERIHLGYESKWNSNCNNRVKSLRAILISYRFYRVMWFRRFSQLCVKNMFFSGHFRMFAATHVALKYIIYHRF